MTDALLVLWICLIGIDRFDLLAGGGPVLLSPFLLLTPILLLVVLPGCLRRRDLQLRGDALPYLFFAIMLGGIAVASASFAHHDPLLSARRSALLVFQMLSTFLVAVVIANRPDPARILWRGAALGLMAGFLFNVAQGWVWITDPTAESSGVLNLTPATYGSIIPRLSVGLEDPNRGGMLMAAYLYLLLRLGPRFRFRGVLIAVTVTGIVLTLSRSAYLAVFCIFVMEALQVVRRGEVRLSRMRVLSGFSAAAAAFAGLLVFPQTLDRIGGALEPVLGRFTGGDNTHSIHFDLIFHGLDVATSSLHNAIVGIGFGMGFTVLQDFFPDFEHSNFHSLYVTALVETGVLSLVLVIFLLAWPVVRSGPLAGLIVGYAAFNVFYQTITEPSFWFLLALAWVAVGSGARAIQRRPAADVPMPPKPGSVYALPVTTLP